MEKNKFWWDRDQIMLKITRWYKYCEKWEVIN